MFGFAWFELSATPLNRNMKKYIGLIFLSASMALAQQNSGQALTQVSAQPLIEDEAPTRSLGMFVTLVRLSHVTDKGVVAIPQGALVSVLENPAGFKFAVFRQARVPIQDMKQLSNDPAKVAAISTSAPGSSSAKSSELLPGAVMSGDENSAPEARTQEQIRLDAAGNVVSRSKTTTISDGAGNTTTIMQGRSGGMSPDQAARLAAAQQRINQQKEAISDLKIRRSQKAIVSGYEGKLKEMNDLLGRMEVEMARMRAEYNQ
jgi:hypothetical protein